MIDELEIECPYCAEELPAQLEMEAGEHSYVEQCGYCPRYRVEFRKQR